jgi:flagellar biosynthesis protein FlhG
MGPNQASGLSRVAIASSPQAGTQSTRVIAVTSGKGGVGKTVISVNLGITLQKMGRRVLLLDADLGLANVDVALGLAPHWNLAHVLRGERTIEEILVEGPAGMKILPASSGIEEMTQLSSSQKMALLDQFEALSFSVDVLIIDTAAGISDNVVHFNSSAAEMAVVITPEPTSITDAYALIKVMSQNHGRRRFHLIFNQVKSPREARELFEKFLKITGQYLDVSLETLGHVVADRNLPRAIRRQRALVDLNPESAAADCFKQIARRFDRVPAEERGPAGGLGFFWRQMTLGGA